MKNSSGVKKPIYELFIKFASPFVKALLELAVILAARLFAEQWCGAGCIRTSASAVSSATRREWPIITQWRRHIINVCHCCYFSIRRWRRSSARTNRLLIERSAELSICGAGHMHTKHTPFSLSLALTQRLPKSALRPHHLRAPGRVVKNTRKLDNCKCTI